MATVLDKSDSRELRFRRLRRAGYISIALLIMVVFILSIVQVWFAFSTENIPAYGSVRANDAGLPPPDERGAFLLLKKEQTSKYPGTVLQLLATTEAGVVDPASGAHLGPSDIEAVFIQSSAVSEGADYRVYRLADPTKSELIVERQPGGKAVLIKLTESVWPPGAYVVDTPSDGMFGGRTYYQFYVDEPQK